MKKDINVIAVIPARYASSRLPGKVLRDVAGRPLLERVYRAASRSRLIDQLIVATDSNRVARSCEERGIPAMLTGEHASGSDRVHEVMTRTDGDIYLNIQGDEPTLRAEHIETLLEPLLEERATVASLRTRITVHAAKDPNVVKVVTDRADRALYFSRLPIPYHRDASPEPHYSKHIGLYAFTREALEIFHTLPPSRLELSERLEQLRLLENGIPIHVPETPYDTVGVDTEEDLERVVRLFEEGRH